VILVALGTVSGPLAAQDSDDSEARSLDRSTIQSNSVLTKTQRKELDDYVTYWVEQLKGAVDRVPAARDKIEQPFNNPGATKIFISAYSAAVIRKLAGAVNAQRHPVATRLNAMLIVQNIAAPDVENLIRLGLDDPSPSVVYLTAKAVGQIGKRDELSPTQKTEILGMVGGSLRQERHPLVAGQLLLSMLGLVKMDEAQEAVLDALDYRVTDHAKDPNIPMDADWRALRDLFRHLLRTTGELRPSQAKEWARVTYRLYSLSVTVLDGELADEGMDKQYRSVIKLCDTILRWLLAEQGINEATFPGKDKLKQAILNERYDVLAVQADKWRQLLKGKPLSIPAGRLEVRFPR